MAKSFLSILLIIISSGGNALAFSSGRQSIIKRQIKDTPISLSLNNDDNNNDDDDYSSTNTVQKRRAFLVNFAALPILTTFANNAAYARDAGKLVYGGDDIMSKKEHGTTSSPVQDGLRYGVDQKLADKICSFNRVFAEMGGSFQSTSFEKEVREIVASTNEPVTFYDSVSGKPLFKAPVNRSTDEFIAESKVHGWPSFRDDEVVWENVRVLKSSGEIVSTVGTHLGHNLPDNSGNRYCINLVSIAGNPV